MKFKTTTVDLSEYSAVEYYLYHKMETCVLIPPEFALGYSKDAKFSLLSTRTLKPGMLFHPFQGNIRIDKLAPPRFIDENDVSKKMGS